MLKHIFRYVVLMGILIIPIYFFFDYQPKFPILMGCFIGGTLAFWIAFLIMKKKGKL
ncbi:MAG: hypothetical protein J6W84_00395 [Bacteroidales bacterium]|nr:hypothetical protein [Bacteroidales bacterium]MBQ7489831.1 hypothetical protein [Bacteroidales bacterium]